MTLSFVYSSKLLLSFLIRVPIKKIVIGFLEGGLALKVFVDKLKSVVLIQVLVFTVVQFECGPNFSCIAGEKPKETAASLCGQADGLLNSRKFDQAWPLLQRAAKLEPNSSVFNLTMGRFYQLKCYIDNTGTEQKAIDCYSRAIAATPASAIAYRRRADMYMEIGEFDKAQRDIQIALKLNSKDFEAYKIMTSLLAERKLDKESLAYANRWVELSPEHEPFHCQALLGRASILDRLGRYDEESADLKAAYAVRSNTMSLKNTINKSLAVCLFKAGKLSDAETIYSSLIRSDPQDWELLASRSKVLIARGNFKGALADINGAITIEPSVKSLHQQREKILRLIDRSTN